MKPAIGRIVIVRNLHGSGSLDQPGIITRTWSKLDTSEGPQAVNIKVLPDGQEPIDKSSVSLFDSSDAAARYLMQMVGHSPTIAFWPEREPEKRAVAIRKAA